jgi:hypothetical protein
MPFAKYRPSVLNNVLTTINSNTSEKNKKRNWFQSEAQQSFIIRKTNSQNASKSTEAIVYSKCCFIDHISQFSTNEKKQIFNYKSMKTIRRKCFKILFM